MSGKPAARQNDATMKWPDSPGSAGVRIGAPTGVACSVVPWRIHFGNPVNPLLSKSTARRNRFRAARLTLFVLSRTYSSYRTKTPPVGIFGPGWKAPL